MYILNRYNKNKVMKEFFFFFFLVIKAVITERSKLTYFLSQYFDIAHERNLEK